MRHDLNPTLQPVLSSTLHIGEHLLSEFAGSHETAAVFSIDYDLSPSCECGASAVQTMRMRQGVCESSVCLVFHIRPGIRNQDFAAAAHTSLQERGQKYQSSYL